MCGMNRTEFEHLAQDLNISPAELYVLATGHRLSGDLLEERLGTCEFSSVYPRKRQPFNQEHLPAGIQASLPIGPSCC